MAPRLVRAAELDKMSSKKVSGVSVIITCQEEEAGTDLTTDEYDQLVKVLKILSNVQLYFSPSALYPDNKVY